MATHALNISAATVVAIDPQVSDNKIERGKIQKKMFMHFNGWKGIQNDWNEVMKLPFHCDEFRAAAFCYLCFWEQYSKITFRRPYKDKSCNFFQEWEVMLLQAPF